MTIEKDVAAEIASELASLQAEQGSEPEEAAPEADSVEGEPEASETLEETEEAIEEPAVDEGAFKDAVAALIDAGDLKAAAERLGLPADVFKLNNRQFKAARVTAQEAKAAATKAAADLATAGAAQRQAETLNARAEEIYGPVVAGKFHYKGDPGKGVPPDPLKARAALELLFEDTYENIFANLAKAAKGMDPAQYEVLKLRKELSDERAAKAKETETATAAQTEASERAGIVALLAKTPLAELADEAAADIQKAVRASYNPALKRYTKTVKEAYVEVKASYAAKAAKLAKLGKPAAAPAVKEARQPLATPRVAAKKMTQDEEFAAELAAVKKETQAAARRDQRRAR